MKNQKIYKDIEWVRKCIRNPNNKKEHLPALYKLVYFISNKYGWHESHELLVHLYEELNIKLNLLI